jgi:hypothetical protein
VLDRLVCSDRCALHAANRRRLAIFPIVPHSGPIIVSAVVTRSLVRPRAAICRLPKSFARTLRRSTIRKIRRTLGVLSRTLSVVTR